MKSFARNHTILYCLIINLIIATASWFIMVDANPQSINLILMLTFIVTMLVMALNALTIFQDMQRSFILKNISIIVLSWILTYIIFELILFVTIFNGDDPF